MAFENLLESYEEGDMDYIGSILEPKLAYSVEKALNDVYGLDL